MLGTHHDEGFLQFNAVLAPLGMRRVSTAGAEVYERHLAPQRHTVGKAHPQKLARQPLTFRTRLKRVLRKTRCFSKSMRLHEIVIGLFVNRDEFGVLP